MFLISNRLYELISNSRGITTIQTKVVFNWLDYKDKISQKIL